MPADAQAADNARIDPRHGIVAYELDDAGAARIRPTIGVVESTAPAASTRRLFPYQAIS
jgi:hypothetical protein